MPYKKKFFFLPMWRAKDFSFSLTTNFHAFSVDFFAWKMSRKDPRKLLTISHSVLTWVSVSCLHSFSCSIHWSKSFKVVLSSMIIFTRNFCRLYRIFNHLFHTKRTQETIGSVYWLFFKNCFLAKRIKYLTKKLVIRKTDNCNPNKFKMANRLGMTKRSAGEVCVQWVSELKKFVLGQVSYEDLKKRRLKIRPKCPWNENLIVRIQKMVSRFHFKIYSQNSVQKSSFESSKTMGQNV